jgi:hypothetical protein
MENLGKTTGNTIKGLGVLIAEIKKVPGLSTVKDILTYGNIFNTLGKLNEINQRGKYPTAAAKETPAMGRIAAQQRKLEAAALKNGVALRKAENEQLKAKTEVDKLKDKFDVERIGLMKALNEATDAETILRLNAKIAILDNNEALAKKINAELEAGKKAKELADTFGNAATALTTQIAKMQAMNDALINKINDKIAAGTYNPTGVNIPGISQLFPTPQGPLGSIDYTVPMGSGNPVYAPGTSGTPMSYADVRLTIDVAQAGDQFAQLIADSVQVAQRSGYSTTSAGSLN